MKKIIRLEDVCFAYEDIVALRHIDMEILEGECVALQGSNGCGKSTLLKLLNGLIFPSEGSYYFEDKLITRKTMSNNSFAKTFHQKMGFVFQNSEVQLFCNNVREEISFGPRQMGLDEDTVNKRADDVMKLMHIEKLDKRACFHLSGGEKKKVALACVLSMNPKVLVLDEPLSGLDKSSSEWLVQFLGELKSMGKTIIISTHNDELAKILADRVVWFNENHEII